MKLRHITFTGADDNTNLSEILDISKKYPFIEWGFFIRNTIFHQDLKLVSAVVNF